MSKVAFLIDELEFYNRVSKFLENIQIDNGAESVEDAYAFALEESEKLKTTLREEGVEISESK